MFENDNKYMLLCFINLVFDVFFVKGMYDNIFVFECVVEKCVDVFVNEVVVVVKVKKECDNELLK